MLNTESLVEALLEKLNLEAKKSQQNEARYRLKRLATANLYKMLQIKKVPEFFQPTNQIPLSLPFSGLIQDIDLLSLTKLIKKLQHPALVHQEEKILVTKLAGDYVHKDQVLAFISIDETSQASEIQGILQKAFIIRKPTQDSEELQNLLKQLKNRTELAIRGNDEGLFQKMMGAYTYLFDLYVDLPLPPSADPFPELFRGWSAIAIANLQLNEIIKTASSLGNDQIISHLAHKINEIAAIIISRTDEHLNESFADVLRQFVTMYYVSFNAGNKTGMSQSFYYLTGSLVDRNWIRKLQNIQNNLQIIQNLRAVLGIFLRTQAELIRDMIRNQDVINFHQLLKKMHPNELLAYFNTVLPDSGERFRLQNALRTTSPDQSTPLEQRLDALNIIECIPKEAGAFYTELLYVLASYLVEGYEQHEFTLEFTKQILKIIQKGGTFISFPNSLALLLELTGPGVTFIKWDLFNRHPDTKQGFSPDDERKYLLFYSLNGIEVLAHQPEIGPLPVSNIQAILPRLKQVCKQIVDTSSTWELILGVSAKQIEKLAEDFINVNQKISEAWKADRENKIIVIDLDPNRNEIFVKKVVTTIESAQGLRSLLQSHGRFNKAPSVPGKLMWGINIWTPDKEDFTILSQGTNLVEDSPP